MDRNLHRREQLALLELLRELRVAAGLRQQDLAQRLGQPQSFVSKFESGERRLGLLEVRQICGALGLSLSEFAEQYEARLREVP